MAKDTWKWQHLQPYVEHMEARLDEKVAERGPGETWMSADPVHLLDAVEEKLMKAQRLLSQGGSTESVVGAALADVGNLAAMAYQRMGGVQATPPVPGAGGRCDP